MSEISDDVDGMPTLVVDNGSDTIKAGFAGEDNPTAIFPTICGGCRCPHFDPNTEQFKDSFYVGEEALAKRGILSLKCPIEHGIVTDWDKMEKVWHYTFNEALKADTTKQPLLMSECPISHKTVGHREKMTQIMFETFELPSLYLANQAVLGLYASGRVTGVLLDIGTDVSYAVPIYEGHALLYATQYRGLGGRQLTEYLMKMLARRGRSVINSSDRNINVRDVKEKFCYVALDYEQEMQNAYTTNEMGLPAIGERRMAHVGQFHSFCSTNSGIPLAREMYEYLRK